MSDEKIGVFIVRGEEANELSQESIDIMQQRINYATEKLANDLTDDYYRKGLDIGPNKDVAVITIRNDEYLGSHNK